MIADLVWFLAGLIGSEHVRIIRRFFDQRPVPPGDASQA